MRRTLPAGAKPRSTVRRARFPLTATLLATLLPALPAQAQALALALAQETPPAPTTTPAADPAAASGDTLTEAGQSHEKTSFFDRFRDEEDGKLDFSNVLAKGGFIPVPIVITEPAVDGGYGLMAQFITMPKDNPAAVTRRMVGAAKTGNGSYGYGYFQQGSALDQRLHYRFGAGRGKAILTMYPALLPSGFEYTNKYDYAVLASARMDIGKSGFSIGPMLDFRQMRSRIDFAKVPDELEEQFQRKLNLGALGGGAHFDNRDNPLAPTKGVNAYVQGRFYADFLGSDRKFQRYEGHAYAFHPLGDGWRLGAKVEIDAARGNYPAFIAPSISLRGVQAARYQGATVLSTEAELTYQLAPRWSVLAFGGMGATDPGHSRIFDSSGAIFAGGGGLRYRIARKLGMDAGLDVAYGPGGAVFYIQLGQAWSFGMD